MMTKEKKVVVTMTSQNLNKILVLKHVYIFNMKQIVGWCSASYFPDQKETTEYIIVVSSAM